MPINNKDRTGNTRRLTHACKYHNNLLRGTFLGLMNFGNLSPSFRSRAAVLGYRIRYTNELRNKELVNKLQLKLDYNKKFRQQLYCQRFMVISFCF